MQESENSVQDSLKSLQWTMSQLSDRVNKIDEEMTDLEALNGKLADLKSMMKDIWKHQRRRVKKQHDAVAAQPQNTPSQQRDEEKFAVADETKTDDEDFRLDDTTIQTPDEGGEGKQTDRKTSQ